MTDKTEARALATERRMWKRAQSTGRDVSAQQEADAARVTVDATAPLLFDRARALRDAHLSRAAKIIALEVLNPGGSLDSDIKGDVAHRYKEALRLGEEQDDRVQRLSRIITEERAVVGVSVKSEPRTYGEGSEHSHYLDLARAACPGTRLHDAAVARLQRHAREVSVESSLRSEEGKRAIRSASTRGRGWGGSEETARTEIRSLTTAGGSGAGFVTPQYVVEDWADYRTYGPAFVDQTSKVPDSGVGMQLNIPSITSAASVAQQTEGSTVPNDSPTGAYITSNLVTFAGEVDISQALFDRAGPIGIDKILHAQMTEQLWTSIDSYALTQAISTAGSVTSASVFSNANFWGDVAKGSANMMTASGTVLPPTHLFMPPTFYQWATAQVATTGRPLLTPQPSDSYVPIAPAPDGDHPVGYTGQRILTSSVFTDGNLPASGSNCQFVLANAANIYTLMSEPVARAIPETLANDLNVVIQLYCVFGIVVRHATAVQVISGAAYPTAPSFA